MWPEILAAATTGAVALAGLFVLRAPNKPIEEQSVLLAALLLYFSGVDDDKPPSKRKLKKMMRAVAPPRSFLVDMLIPIKLSEDFHLNLEEVMPTLVRVHGPRKARWVRRAQIFHFIWGHYRTKVGAAFGKVIKVISRG